MPRLRGASVACRLSTFVEAYRQVHHPDRTGLPVGRRPDRVPAKTRVQDAENPTSS